MCWGTVKSVNMRTVAFLSILTSIGNINTRYGAFEQIAFKPLPSCNVLVLNNIAAAFDFQQLRKTFRRSARHRYGTVIFESGNSLLERYSPLKFFDFERKLRLYRKRAVLPACEPPERYRQRLAP